MEPQPGPSRLAYSYSSAGDGGGGSNDGGARPGPSRTPTSSTSVPFAVPGSSRMALLSSPGSYRHVAAAAAQQQRQMNVAVTSSSTSAPAVAGPSNSNSNAANGNNNGRPYLTHPIPVPEEFLVALEQLRPHQIRSGVDIGNLFKLLNALQNRLALAISRHQVSKSFKPYIVFCFRP